MRLAHNFLLLKMIVHVLFATLTLFSDR